MIFESDTYLLPYRKVITDRYHRLILKREEIAGYGGTLSAALNNHLFYGVHLQRGEWCLREWAPNATAIYVTGDFNAWERRPEYMMHNIGNGNWELRLPEKMIIPGELFKWYVEWNGGAGERLPAYATRCVQDKTTKLFAAEIQDPVKQYKWRHKFKGLTGSPLIYEAHIGMSSEREEVADFTYFRKNVLPHIASLGYNTVQIMALQEHPYYGSFGYQVSNFFALSSRFGTPDEFKALVDEAHSLGLAVIMDIVHSHAGKNEAEGIGNLCGLQSQYFHEGDKGLHPAWGTYCFNYGKDEVIYFLLSNCKFWMEEYHLDGFRFDGVTSMLYHDHGLGRAFTSYEDYFSGNTDEEALVYLGLANMLVREINPSAITIAEEMSGMPGLAAPLNLYGNGFSYRMSMGVADHWIKWIKELRDEQWNMSEIYGELTNKRADERTISYAECHDQALVGDKTIIFRLLDAKMYTQMSRNSSDPVIERGVALHKMIRLATIATAGNGYLNFMGNEFGHPEWIDCPREGNNWSFFYARRQWSLCKNSQLRYGDLMNFDASMISLFEENAILDEPPISIYNDNSAQVMVIKRRNYLFAFNFSTANSYQGYEFSAEEGAYKVVLDTDWEEFGGFGRNDRNLKHFTNCKQNSSFLSLYLPAKTAIVLTKDKND